MLDKETRSRIADYFEAVDLVDFLDLKVSDVIEAFADEIEEHLDEIEEEMGV